MARVTTKDLEPKGDKHCLNLVFLYLLRENGFHLSLNFITLLNGFIVPAYDYEFNRNLVS